MRQAKRRTERNHWQAERPSIRALRNIKQGGLAVMGAIKNQSEGRTAVEKVIE